MLRDNYASEIERIRSKYDDPRSAVLPLLAMAQDEYGYLTDEVIREVAAMLELPDTDIFEVVGFYTLFYDRPVGKWVLQVCDDVPCCYLGAEELIADLTNRLGVQENEVTPDGMFVVERVKCLAACDRAPLLQANLGYIYDIYPERVDSLLRELRAFAEQGIGLKVSGTVAEDYEFDKSGRLQQVRLDLGAMPTARAESPSQDQTTDPSS